MVAIPVAKATDGYFAHGFGAINKSMGGAGVALPLDGLSPSNNPAGLAFLDTRLDVGVTLFNPDRGYTADPVPPAVCGGQAVPPCVPGTEPITSGTFDSDNELFAIPSFGFTWRLSERDAIGFALGANGGLNTEYDRPVFVNFGPRDEQGNPIPGTPFSATEPTGADLQQIFIGATYARRLSERHALGITPILLVQSFEVEGLEPFKAVSVDPDNVTNNGADTALGVGVQVGYLGQFTDWLSVGVSYRTELASQDFEDYSGLLAGGGEFNAPAVLLAGIGLRPTPTLRIALDYKRIFYSEVAALGNANDVPLDPQNPSLGTDDGLGFGWEDMDIFKIGAEWDVTPVWTLRAGFSHGEQPVPGAQALFNILAPAVIEDHVTVGVGRRFGSKHQLNAFYMHAFEETVEGTNPNTGPQTGSIRMFQNEVGLSYTRFF